MTDKVEMTEDRPQPVTVATFSLEQDTGRLVLGISTMVSDVRAFGLTAMTLLLQMLQEEHLKANRPAIEVPKLVFPGKNGRHR